ncbi:unspecific monooxygenase [Oesophagostomum dentatum]|uniref:Unspecific monooxygenase n=1 Tax=Oesophagostomum dentatum TaxID=61180 RepID=A0A0B1SWL6_OESDE|nr:unspecific monooxygenase [Oesophagostomum dentatum]
MILELLLPLLVLFLIYNFYWKRRNLPPGPTLLPFIGNLASLIKHEPGYSAFEMWRQKYGPVYTFWIGPYPFVMISDLPTLKDTFVKDDDAYAGKFHMEEISKICRGGNYGIVDTVGDMWREQRRFVLHALKDFGLGKDAMEQRVGNQFHPSSLRKNLVAFHVLIEMEAMTETLQMQQGTEVNLQDVFDVAVGSVVNQLLFGYRFDEEHVGEFRELKSLISSQMRDFAHPSATLVFIYPWMRHLPYFSRMYNVVISYRNAFYSFFDKQIEAHAKQANYKTDEYSDYVEAYLKEQRRREAEENEGYFSRLQLQNVCLDLWFAGMETTSNTLSWCAVYLLNNSDVQIFPDPLIFNPSRFLDDDGKLKVVDLYMYVGEFYVKVDELISFSIGKRQCLGEGLANVELFLFIGNLFNRFEISSVDSANPPDMKKTFGTTVQPNEHRCFVKARSH